MARTNKRNRKKNKKKVGSTGGFAVPAPLLTILVMAAVFCLAYLWIHTRSQSMGARIQKLEVEFQRVHHRVLNEETKWANMKSLVNVRDALNRHQILMDWPKEHRVIRVKLSNTNLYVAGMGELAHLAKERRNE